ncbi:MAG: hypothetical protein UR73_C0031G0004 [candidate division WS6 bacterium GW2011_GWF1_35_23]|uniref:Methyltransferase type 11 domain-containing protein n=1 Tax=candidate division WS6 bacterium GW2011_GWF1_35_23 TaxID=1619097 RepID=A0A0G0CIL6_9BACT|nr:MAG: hypothetical protein UR73_C0031G0004 [candidate division WS6 bacterium GW2011_GWF1_35_23]
MENILKHYSKLIFFNGNRFKGNNSLEMRKYFAKIFVHDIEKFVPLKGKKFLDVGGARGEFCAEISSLRKVEATNLDPKLRDPIFKNTIKGFANEIPFKDETFDIVLCRGVMEHIPFDLQQPSVDEIYRVTKKGGYCYFVIPPWYNPHAGHGLKPFHIFPFKVAKFLRNCIFRSNIRENSLAEMSYYPVTFRKMKKMIERGGYKIIGTQDIHFRLHFMTRIPILNEILVPAVAFIGRK